MVGRPSVAVDVVGGARAWQIETSVSAEARIAPYFRVGASASRRLSWVDPIVGVRMRAAFSPRWSVIGCGDVGGYDH